MIANVDISLQVSQLNKTGNQKRHKGCAMGMVSSDRQIKYSVFLSKKELEKIIKYYGKDFPLKTIYVKIHSAMVYLCVEPYLSKLKKIKLCRDFAPPILTRELYKMFPVFKKIKKEWVGGKGNKSIADKYANRIRKHPEFASQLLTLDKIKNMETPQKSE